jgi:hypothetical protein
MSRIKKKKVYIPTSDTSNIKVGTVKKDFYKEFDLIEAVEETEVFVFTIEELKKLLEDYTNRIIKGVELITCDSDGSDTCDLDEESITSQLTVFLEEIGCEDDTKEYDFWVKKQ